MKKMLMRPLAVMLCSIGLCCNLIYAQKATDFICYGRDITAAKPVKELDQFFKNYRLCKIYSSLVNTMVSGQKGEFNMGLQLGSYNFNLPLEVNPLIDPKGVLRAITEKGEEILAPGEQITYQGASSKGLQHDIRLTITDGLIYGYITQNGRTVYIEPACQLVKSAEKDVYVLYEPADVLPNASIKCGFIEQQKYHPSTGPERKNNGESLSVVPEVCRIADMAYAADYSMVRKFGTVTDAKNHIVAIFNMVEPLYTFQLNVDFNLVEQYISSCSACDPWSSSNDADTLLSSFANWGPAGFTATHDLAGLWSDRSFDENIPGLAYTGGLCGINRYHINQDYTTSLASLKVLWAHQIGHNFGAEHDAASDLYIMNPAISAGNSSFSSASVNSISAYMDSVSCLNTCIAPADLVVENQSISPILPYIVAGTIINSAVTVKNYGRGIAEASTLKYYISSNTTYEDGDVYVDRAAITSLSPGSIHTFFKTLLIPPTTTLGTWYILFRADANGIITEANENNNVAASEPFSVIGIPDASLRQARPEAIADRLDCYPNPITGRMTISYESLSEHTELVIRNVQGQEINRQLLPGKWGTAEFDMSGLAPGVYFIYLFNDDEMLKVQKVLKQ